MAYTEIDRRIVLKTAGTAILAGFATAVLPIETANAADQWKPRWDYSKVRTPNPITNEPDERVGNPLSTAAGNTIAMTSGPVEYQDSFGDKISFPGGLDHASLVIVKGPVGKANGGVDVSPIVVPVYNWVGVTQDPKGGLKPEHLETIVKEREASIRSTQGNGFNGRIQVVIIDGRSGAIEETRDIRPKKA